MLISNNTLFKLKLQMSSQLGSIVIRLQLNRVHNRYYHNSQPNAQPNSG